MICVYVSQLHVDAALETMRVLVGGMASGNDYDRVFGRPFGECNACMDMFTASSHRCPLKDDAKTEEKNYDRMGQVVSFTLFVVY